MLIVIYESDKCLNELLTLANNSLPQKNDDNKRISGLTAAVYVLDCIFKGQSESQIMHSMGWDEQIISSWMSFLTRNRWIKKENFYGSKWTVSDSGRLWIKRYGFSIRRVL
ncbi:MAG: hypothetical protein WA395_04055 [Nitrososphaeraceae archaeon]